MRKYIAALIFFVLAFSFVALSSQFFPQFEILELRSYDLMMSVFRGPLPTPEDIVIVAIDETSLEIFEEDLDLRWPWPRAVHGDLIRNLDFWGARAIAFDVIFAGEQDPVQDDDMALAIRQSQAPVILAATLDTTVDSRFGILTKPIFPTDKFIDAGAHVGYAMMHPDLDESLRKARISVNGDPELAVQAYMQGVGPLDEQEMPIFSYQGGDPQVLINYVAGARGIRTYNYYEALDPDNPSGPAIFENKIVLVGRAMAVEDLSERRNQKDFFSVPFRGAGLMPGVEVHANVLNMLMTEAYITPASDLQTWFLLLCLGVLTTVLALGFDSFPLKISLWFLLALGYQVMAVLLFVYQSYWLYTVQPFVIMFSIFGLNTLYQYRVSEKEKAHIRRALKGYVSHQVMDEVMKHPDGLELGGSQVEATVLFSDIAGFSKISENTTPRELFAMLNDYFTRMGDAIMNRDGMINKYIGDAVMAIWNTPLTHQNHAGLACQAALDMKRIIEEMPPLKARIGINTGPMVAGNLGHAERMEYTVIGDAVNLASRLEGANKPFGTSIMISDTTEKLVRGQFLLRPLDRIRVIGKQMPVTVYEVLAGIDEPVPDSVHGMVQSFEKLAKAYELRDWERACALASAHLEEYPQDKVAAVYLERCRQFLTVPPPQDWDGVYALESK